MVNNGYDPEELAKLENMSKDKRTIGDNPANINPIQKIWNHIKYRESYRPFAPAVIDEKKHLYFEISRKDLVWAVSSTTTIATRLDSAPPDKQIIVPTSSNAFRV